MEHMAFSVVGRWGEQGVTSIRITELGQAFILGSWNRKTMSVKNLIEAMNRRVQRHSAEVWNVVECAELMNKLAMEYCVYGLYGQNGFVADETLRNGYREI